MLGHVEATFVLRNHGAAAESFAVWSPLAAAPGADDWGDDRVANFAAWVNGAPATISEQQCPGQRDRPASWATWPVTFPAGRDVTLRVTYDTQPVGYKPWGTFYYVLETGAGWWGTIGTGTVTVRLPYPVDANNTVLDSEHD